MGIVSKSYSDPYLNALCGVDAEIESHLRVLTVGRFCSGKIEVHVTWPKMSTPVSSHFAGELPQYFSTL